MGVNTEMHDCEPAMTQAQHFNLSYSPFFPALPQLYPRVDYPHTLGSENYMPFTPSPPPSFKKSAQQMTLTGLIF